MYKYSNPEHTSVTNLETGTIGIHPGVWHWEDYEIWVAAGGITEAFDARDVEEILSDLRSNNKRMAEAKQEEVLAQIERNELRKSLGLPPLVMEEDEAELKHYVKLVQGDIDNPQAIEGYNPPLPPGVTPPSYNSITIEVTRVPGWQGKLGWRAVIKSKSEGFTPNNLAMSVHTGAGCAGYKYTTGAFQFDAVKEEYFAVCPPGHEPGSGAEHFGLLYGAARLSCFTLLVGQGSILVYAYNQ